MRGQMHSLRLWREDLKMLKFRLLGLIIFFVLGISGYPAHAQDEDLSVLKNWYKYTDRENVLYHFMAT